MTVGPKCEIYWLCNKNPFSVVTLNTHTLPWSPFDCRTYYWPRNSILITYWCQEYDIYLAITQFVIGKRNLLPVVNSKPVKTLSRRVLSYFVVRRLGWEEIGDWAIDHVVLGVLSWGWHPLPWNVTRGVVTIFAYLRTYVKGLASTGHWFVPSE